MRLSVSLALWLVVLTALVLGVHGWSQLAEEEEELYAAASRELTLVTTAVRAGVENAVRDDQEVDIAYLLEQLEQKDPSSDVFVFGDGEDLLSSSWGSAPNLDGARELVRRYRALDSVFVQRLPGGDLAGVAPVRTDGGLAGYVVVLRPPTALRADLDRERNAVLVSIGATVVVLSVGIWAVLKMRLQRPISQVIATVRRVAAGDLSARIRRSGSDELAELAREFDATIAALEATRQQLSREAETRERLEAEMLRSNRLAIVGELAAMLAHEVGSPLQVLGGRARDMVRRTDVPDDIARSAGIIADQVDRVSGIVERFLDVARRKSPIVEDVDVEVAVKEVTELLSSQARRVDVRFEVNVPHGLILRADPSQLQQVLLNLLQNAMRASPRGATVRIQAERSSFRARPQGPTEPAVALRVEDEGPGISESDRDLIFQPFFTGWSKDPKRVAGTGLGLSVVKSIVTDHGGGIEVDCGRNGYGARFTARFPTATKSPATAKGASV